MNIAVIGTGYVGLPTGVGFAELGHNVVCIDKIKEKIDLLNSGVIPIYEAGLEELFIKNASGRRLRFTTDICEGIKDAEVIIIAVGTPANLQTHEADLSYVYNVAEEVAPLIDKYMVIAVKSTVPVGTNDAIEEIIRRVRPSAEFDVVSLPEFLREGFAVEDFFNPDRIVIGSSSQRPLDVINRLYESFRGKTEFLYVSRKSAEAIKYASNSFLAVKIHYINEMADFCERAGANINEVAKGMGLDSRIGPKFLQPGPGYGGSCFPKDTLAMSRMSHKNNITMTLVDAAIEQNYLRQVKLASRIYAELKEFDKPVLAVLGVTFKKGTDDIRESPAINIIQELLKKQVMIKLYDPKGMENAKSIFKDAIGYYESAQTACKDAHACAILTEWDEFKEIDYLSTGLKQQLIFDFRLILDRDKLRKEGFTVETIGGV